MNKKELSAGTKDEQRTTADDSTSASVEASPMLSAALSVRGDKLIAKFMKIHVTDFIWKEHLGLVHCDEYGDFQIDEDLQYYSPHTNWNDLMPVVEKINKTLNPLTKSLTVTTAGVFLTKIYNAICEVDIKLAHSEIVSAIKWYNDNAVSVGSR